MKLLVISHTKHYLNKEGGIVGWSPTVNELNHLLDTFEEIYHCAPLYKEPSPAGTMAYSDTERIKFIPLKFSGGDHWYQKVSVITTAPYNLRKVASTLKKVDIFQFRSPTGMGVYMIPFLNLFAGIKGWYKYAGNWVQENPPLGYQIQRFLLKKLNNRVVTINGNWPNQKSNFLSFENPCLTKDEFKEGEIIIEKKDYLGKLNFCFTGRIETAKGVRTILEVLKKLNAEERVGKVHFIGDGKEKSDFEEIAKKLDFDIFFHGFMNRKEVIQIMKESHLFLLPSTASEGFPKVIAEAASFGCVPVVSDISSITQYVKNGVSGYILNNKSNNMVEELTKCLDQILIGNIDLKQIAFKAHAISERFTFEHYNYRIKNDVLIKTK